MYKNIKLNKVICFSVLVEFYFKLNWHTLDGDNNFFNKFIVMPRHSTFED